MGGKIKSNTPQMLPVIKVKTELMVGKSIELATSANGMLIRRIRKIMYASSASDSNTP